MVLLSVLAPALLGVIPGWPRSRGWGYAPRFIVGLLLVLVLIMLGQYLA